VATPRKRWFKVADSILREDWDDATLATAVRLMAWLNQRWRRDAIDHDQAGSAVIGAADAMAITRKMRPLVALKSLASLPLAAGWSSASASLDDDKRPTRVTLTWPKYADFQSDVARPSGNRRPTVSLSDSDSDSGTVQEKKKPMPTEVGGASRSKQRSATKAERSSPTEKSPTAVSLFMDAYRARKGVTYPLDKRKDPRLLNAVYDSVDRNAEAFGALLEQFFALDDGRLRQYAWNASVLKERWQACHRSVQLKAQAEAEQRRIDDFVKNEPPIPAEARELFAKMGCK